MLIFHNIERSFESFYQISYIRGKHSVPYNQHFWKVSTQYIYSTPYVYSFESKCPPNMAIPYPTSIRYSRVSRYYFITICWVSILYWLSTLVWWRLWKIIVVQVEFNTFLHLNEHTERICWYLVRQLDAEPSKIGHFQFSKWLFIP